MMEKIPEAFGLIISRINELIDALKKELEAREKSRFMGEFK